MCQNNLNIWPFICPAQLSIGSWHPTGYWCRFSNSKYQQFPALEHTTEKAPTLLAFQVILTFLQYLLLSCCIFSLITGCTVSTTTILPASKNVFHSWKVRQNTLATKTEWSLKGRIAIYTDKESWQGTLLWNQQTDIYDINFIAPLGQGAFKIQGDKSGASLQVSGKNQYQSADVEALVQKHFGWTIPLNSLKLWVLGRPSSLFAYKDLTLDAEGRLVHLQQLGWNINFKGYKTTDSIDLPRKIYLNNTELNIRLVIDNWQLRS